MPSPTINKGPLSKFMNGRHSSRPMEFKSPSTPERERRIQSERLAVASAELRKAREISYDKEAAEKKRKLSEVTPSDPTAKTYAKQASAIERKLTTLKTSQPTMDEDDEEDKWSVHREAVEAMITHVEGKEWTFLKGQKVAVEMAERHVRSINNDYKTKPSGGMLYAGPPGTGKTTLAEIMACKMGCTFFKVPKGFARGKPEMWNALFGIARESSPAIVFIDECDGVMSNKHTAAVPAVTSLWDPTSTDSSYVLVLGATNNEDVLNDAIKSRFGEPIRFTALDDPTRQEILKGYFEREDISYEMSESDWAKLLPKLRGRQGRSLVNDVCKAAANKVEDDCHQRGIDLKPVTVDDLLGELAKVQSAEGSMSPEALLKAQHEFKEWCKETFKPYQDPETGEKQKAVSVRYIIELMKDGWLAAIGGDPNKIRQAKTSLSPDFTAKLAEWVTGAITTAKIVEGKRKRQFGTRIPQYYGSYHSTMAGKLESYAVKYAESCTVSGYFINMEFKTTVKR